jgi:fumarate reductase subunit C
MRLVKGIDRSIDTKLPLFKSLINPIGSCLCAVFFIFTQEHDMLTISNLIRIIPITQSNPNTLMFSSFDNNPIPHIIMNIIVYYSALYRKNLVKSLYEAFKMIPYENKLLYTHVLISVIWPVKIGLLISIVILLLTK